MPNYHGTSFMALAFMAFQSSSCIPRRMTSRGRWCMVTIMCWVAVVASVRSAQADDSEETTRAQELFFETNIRPILVDKCIRCHGDDKSESGLRLDSAESFSRGGDSGPVFETTVPHSSLLLQAVRYEGLEMPPNQKLPAQQIEMLEQWILRGAKWPNYSTPLKDSRAGSSISDEDRSYWFFQPIRNDRSIHDETDIRTNTVHPIDALVMEKLQQVGLELAEPASDSTLLRRAYLDLVGVPPSWSELQSYLDDGSPDRYERMVDRLLADSRYGERWGRYWLDLVRYAESDGFKQDAFRPTAYRYRDYVIDSLNRGKPYSQFVIEQLAGDELDPNSDEMNAATGYLRHWIYEYNQRDVRSQWNNILNDLTDVTGEVFLGLGFSCARCHDHKFDPLLQKDYFKLQAFFAPLEPRYDIPSEVQKARQWRESKADWDACAAPILDEMKQLEAEVRSAVTASTIDKFPPDVRPALIKPAEAREPAERPIALLAYLQIQNDLQGIDFTKKLNGDALARWKQLKGAIDELNKGASAAPPLALTVRDMGNTAPETRIPGARSNEAIEPGIPAVLGSDQSISISPLPHSTGRRLALAKWIVSHDNPMSWRVITNRIWQLHFGKGLVSNASDFGKLSEFPTNPELLDFLTKYLMDHNGDWKSLHALIMTSSTYRQSSYPRVISQGQAIDPDNKWFWRFPARRMDAEQIRDSILTVTETLDPRAGGASDTNDSNRRSVYQRVMRNSSHPMLSLFDAPDGSSSVAQRNRTTTSLQALYLTNSTWPLKKAESLVRRVTAEHDSDAIRVRSLFRRVLLRDPKESELESLLRFIENHPLSGQNIANSEQASQTESLEPLVDITHALINSNEFLYVE